MTGTEHFEHADLDCKIVSPYGGYWCGYVRRPDNIDPVRWRSEYDADSDAVVPAAVDVHGGITYGPDGDGWVGFDDAHADDLVDESPAETDKAAVRGETKRLAEQIAALTEESQRP